MKKLIAFLFLLTFVNSALAQTDPPEARFPDEGGIEVDASPKQGWEDFPAEGKEDDDKPWWAAVLLWVPNRVLDFIDIFRIDVGVGPAVGGVVRITDQAQFGYRRMYPTSIRVGDMGRRLPILVETSKEKGASPHYERSKDREVCKGEVGLGADVLIVGAYGGICFDELADFLTGLFFIDIKDDDI